MEAAVTSSTFSVTMAILFLLLLTVASLTQCTRDTSLTSNGEHHKSAYDDDSEQTTIVSWSNLLDISDHDRRLIDSAGEQQKDHLPSTNSPSVQHYWHWVEPTQNKHKKGRPKRWKAEVANGEHVINDDPPPREKEMVVLNRASSPANSAAMNSSLSDHHNNSSSTEHGHQDEHHGIHVASWRWDEIGIYFTFTAFIIVAGLAKVAFHHAHVISSRIPESCLLILLGTAVGGILYAAGVGLCEGVRGATRIPGCSVEGDSSSFTFPTFSPQLFFLILLPPIILESSYSLYDRAFADNIGTVLFYAVIGTIINTFLIGLSLLGLANIGWIGKVQVPADSSVTWWEGNTYQLQGTDCLVFSALISAVDPVAVLAIFQEVGINKDLYFLVFGESLLNDAVTVVLYTMMVAFAQMDGNVSGEQYALGFATFFTVSLGGLTIGIICGLLTALITRTTSEVRVVEPLAVLGMAYLSYLSAELFHFSGIISTIGCGLVQAHYAFANVSHKSFTTVKYFIKMLSSTSDAIIFLFLGMVLVNDVHEWHTGFVLWSLFLCLFARFTGVFLLTAIANRFRLKPINLQEQFIMAYGGLRGAVSFSLVEMLEPSTIKPRQMFVTTTLAVILFTVFIQGGTIKLFVRLLHIKKDNKNRKYLMDEMNETLFDHLTAGIEEICGHRGTSFFREKIEYLDERYLKPIFTINTDKNSLQRLFEKLTLSEHVANMYAATDHTGITPIPSTARIEEPEPEVEMTEPPPPVPAIRETEASPLLSLPPPFPTIEEPKRPKGKYPLVRQQSAPPGSLLPPRSTLSPLPKLPPQRPIINARDGLSDLPEFPEVQLRGKSLGRKSRPNSGESTNSASLDAEATANAFRKALRTNSSNQYRRIYQRNNKNLIGDEDVPVELEMALRRRLSIAPARASTTATNSLFNSPMSSPNSPVSPKSPSATSASRQPDGTSFPFTVNGADGLSTTVNKKTPWINAIAKVRQKNSPARSSSASTQPAEHYVSTTENERPLTGQKRAQRPDTLVRPGGFSPLRVIAERETEHSSTTLKMEDAEEENNEEALFKKRSSKVSKETGVTRY